MLELDIRELNGSAGWQSIPKFLGCMRRLSRSMKSLNLCAFMVGKSCLERGKLVSVINFALEALRADCLVGVNVAGTNAKSQNTKWRELGKRQWPQ